MEVALRCRPVWRDPNHQGGLPRDAMAAVGAHREHQLHAGSATRGLRVLVEHVVREQTAPGRPTARRVQAVRTDAEAVMREAILNADSPEAVATAVLEAPLQRSRAHATRLADPRGKSACRVVSFLRPPSTRACAGSCVCQHRLVRVAEGLAPRVVRPCAA